jgi:hypothetical protein
VQILTYSLEKRSRYLQVLPSPYAFHLARIPLAFNII